MCVESRFGVVKDYEHFPWGDGLGGGIAAEGSGPEGFQHPTMDFGKIVTKSGHIAVDAMVHDIGAHRRLCLRKG